jgi:hypothetical protein
VVKNNKIILIVFFSLFINTSSVEAYDDLNLSQIMASIGDSIWPVQSSTTSRCTGQPTPAAFGLILEKYNNPSDTRDLCCFASCQQAVDDGHLVDGHIPTANAEGQLVGADGFIYIDDSTGFVQPPPNLANYQGMVGFNESGVLFDEDGTILPPVPQSDMPLSNVRCIGIGGPSHCFGEGASSGITYDSWVDAGNNATASEIADSFAFARASGMDIHDSRDRDIQDLATGQNIVSESVEDWGYRGQKQNGDVILLFNPTNNDSSSFTTSPAMKTKLATQGVPIDTNYAAASPGSNQRVKSAFSALSTAHGSSGGGGAGGAINISPSLITVTDSSSNVVNQVEIQGEPLTQAEQDELSSNITTTGLNNGDTVNVDSGGSSGGSGETGAGLPGGSAPTAGTGAGSSAGGAIGGVDGFSASGSRFGGSSGIGGTACDTVTCIVQEHNTAWEQTQLFTIINSLSPGNLNGALPTYCFTAIGSNHCFNFNDHSSVFDIMGGIVLIVSSYLAFSIIITRTKA